MKISRAFPRVLSRQYPVVKAGYPLLTVLYLLRMQDVDAVPILPVTKKGARAVFGFSSLPHFMNLGPVGFAELLKGPCEAASDELVLVDADEDLDALLKAFGSRRLGFALVHDAGKTRSGLVSLSDVLSLYADGSIGSERKVEEVGTPIFSMPGDATIRDALKAMFRRRHRRVFLSGEEGHQYVSDRGIMGHLFSPMFLEELGQRGARDVLATPIAEVDRATAKVVGSGASLKTASLALRREKGGCLVTPDGMVVTTWDAVMKPWLAGELTMAKARPRHG